MLRIRLRSSSILSNAILAVVFAVGCEAAAAQSAQMTATEVMQRVIAATGATPPADTVDTLKAGDPNTVVTGIVTTFMDTYPVLQKAVDGGKNLIITHEPTFYNHLDDLKPLADDAVQKQKLAYLGASPGGLSLSRYVAHAAARWSAGGDGESIWVERLPEPK